MRLICPNCGAQYEVPDDVIPASGRDVQCSNCGHTWLESPGASVAAEAAPKPAALPDTAARATHQGPKRDDDGILDRPGRGDTQRHDAVQETAEDTIDTPEPVIEETPDQPDPMAAIAALVQAQNNGGTAQAATARQTPASIPETAQPTRRSLAPDVTEILRQEAALEESLRRGAASGLEMQPDLDIPDVQVDPEQQRAEEARRRLALLKGENPNRQPQTRRERLPDIEEINSTLTATSQRADARHIEAEEAAPRQKRGFRFGFRGVVVVGLIGLLVYAFADKLSQAVPALDPALTVYVDKVDAARLWLDGQMRSGLEAIKASDAEQVTEQDSEPAAAAQPQSAAPDPNAAIPLSLDAPTVDAEAPEELAEPATN